MVLLCTNKHHHQQLVYRHYCSNDRAKQDGSNKSWIAHELLHHALFLGSPDSYSFNDFPQRCWSDQEVDGHRRQFHRLGYRQRHW